MPGLNAIRPSPLRQSYAERQDLVSLSVKLRYLFVLRATLLNSTRDTGGDEKRRLFLLAPYLVSSGNGMNQKMLLYIIEIQYQVEAEQSFLRCM